VENAADNSSGKKNQSVVDSVQRKCWQTSKKRYGNFKNNSFNSKVVRGEKNRQVGVHWSLFVAHAMDPEFRGLGEIRPQQRYGSIFLT